MTPYAVRPCDCAADTQVDHYIAVRRGPLTFALDETLDAEPVIPLTAESIAHAVYTASAPVDCRCALQITAEDGNVVTLVDYPSAGQDDEHNVCAWIKTK